MAAVAIPAAAHANTIDQQQDNAFTNKHVTLYSPHPIAANASIKNDGSNTTIRLEAGATSDIDTVRFQVSTDGGGTWTNIPGSLMTSPNDDGGWAFEWNPQVDSGLALPAAGVLVRAVGHSNLDGLDHPGNSSTLNVNSTDETISLDNGSDLGVWKANSGAHNIILTGTASAGLATARVSVSDPNGFVEPFTSTPVVGGKWKTVYDISGFYPFAPFGYNAPDQLMAYASTSLGFPFTSETEGYTLYNQVITTVTPTATPMNPANPATPVPTTITVKDQKGNPIAGVIVSKHPAGGAGPYSTVGTTDVNGQVTTTQSVNDGDVEYIANGASGDQQQFNAVFGDVANHLALGTAFSSDLVGSSADGPAFDFDEQDGNDVQVQVKDQSNSNFDPTTQSLTYHWRQTAFSNGEVINGTSHNLGPAADVNGLFDIPALNPADFAHGLVSGTYELYASLSDGGTGHAVAEKKVLTVKVGEAAVVYTDAEGDDRASVPAGSTATVNAKLELEDGTGLPGRKVDVNFVLGTEYDEHGNPTGTPDAVIVSNDPATTDATGAFTVKVEDLSHDPNQAEINGRIQSFSAASSFGDWLGDANQATPPVAEPYEYFVDFVANSVPAGSKINVEYGAIPANITDIGDNDTAGPAGTAKNGGILLENAFGDPLAGVSVTLHLDHGFFVPFGAPNKAPAEGNYITTPNSLGDTITVTTNAAGRANFSTSIGRDSGFDDDGKVTATVTASVSAAADSDTNVWSSANPLNVSEVSVVRTPDASQANPVDPAPVNSPVLFDVFAKDQFGNPAAGVEVQITCDASSDSTCPSQFLPPAGLFATSDLDNGGDLTLIANKAGTYGFVATVDNITTRKYGPAPSFATQVQTVEDTFSQTWYAAAIDPSKGATYTMTSSPANPVQPGHPVSVTVTAKDQQGNPLAGVRVVFNRTEDSDTETSLFTDSNGEATYVFEPDSECVDDTVTAIVRDSVTSDGDPADNGVVNQQSVVVSTSRADGTACGTGDPIQVSLTGHSGTRHHHPVDVMKVSATTVGSTLPVTGARVTLKAKIDGQWVTVGKTDRVLNSDGKVKFFPIDQTPRKGTKYQAFVDETATTAAGKSQVFTQR